MTHDIMQPEDECADNACPIEPNDELTDAGTADALRATRLLAFGILPFALLAFSVAVWTYARCGTWVNGLDDRIGEVLGSHAHALASAGRTEEAIVQYRRALEASFENPQQRIWKTAELGELLIDAGRHDEAVDLATTLYSLDAEYGTALFRNAENSLLSSTQPAVALDMAARWCDWSAKQGFSPALALGQLFKAQAYHDSHETDKAATLALEAFATDPSLEIAAVGARVLRDIGQSQKAIPLLDYVIEHDTGAARQEALAAKEMAVKETAVKETANKESVGR